MSASSLRNGSGLLRYPVPVHKARVRFSNHKTNYSPRILLGLSDVREVDPLHFGWFVVLDPIQFGFNESDETDGHVTGPR